MLITKQQHHQLRQEYAQRINRASPACVPHSAALGRRAEAIDLREILPDIPRSKWPELIKAQAAHNLLTLTRDTLPIHDQNATSLCWAFGSTRTLEIQRVYQGATPLLLSPASVAAPLTRGRDRGGSADEAVRQLQNMGACTVDLWPEHDLDERHAKPGHLGDALTHRIEKWATVATWDSQITAAIHQLPVAIGLGWWSHLVCQTIADLDPTNTAIIWFDNSWGPTWHTGGRSQLDEQSGTADLGAFTPLTVSMLANGIKPPPGL